ncbi:MAG: hypothetical protein RXS42_09225, partial [Nitrososphaeria archaeon]
EAVARGGRVEVGRRPRPLENLVPRGSSARAGEVVLGEGTQVSYPTLKGEASCFTAPPCP